MKALTIAIAATMVAAAPLFAQEVGGPDARGYITGLGGFAASVGNTTGNVAASGSFAM
jgi:hypothetical protein